MSSPNSISLNPFRNVRACRFSSCLSLGRRKGEYSSFSGYKVNLDKSEILPLSVFGFSRVKHKFPFNWSPLGFKYLGVFVDSNPKNLYKPNLVSFLQKLGGGLKKISGLASYLT